MTRHDGIAWNGQGHQPCPPAHNPGIFEQDEAGGPRRVFQMLVEEVDPVEVLALAAVAGATALAGWIADRRRAKNRNESSRCASCAADLSGVVTAELFLIHGRLVCADCGESAKRRTLWQFAVLIGATTFATGMIAAEQGLVAMLGIPVGTALLMTAATVHLMKLSNREAQVRIAQGRDSSFEALSGDRKTHALVGAGAPQDDPSLR